MSLSVLPAPPSSRPHALKVADLQSQLAEMQRPGLRKAPSRSLEEHCDERATRAFQAAIKLWGEDDKSLRAFARRIGRNERTVRDYRDGLRAVPLWVLLAFPREARFAGVTELVNSLPEVEASCG